MIRPAQTQLYAVIGTPISHSLSPVMMNEAFNVLNMNVVYVALEVTDLEQDLETLWRVGFGGLSVTIPHKERALKIASDLDNSAKAIGAVNTLKRSKNGWQGRNTDWIGIVRSFQERGIQMHGKRVLVIGAGGASRAVIYAAKQMGAGEIVIANRTYEKGVEVAEEFECEAIPLDDVTAGGEFEIIFQTTPVGMSGYGDDKLPVSSAVLRPGSVVMDLVYNPVWTAFLRKARKLGCIVISGLDMLIYQGAAQFEWWFGMPAPVAAMRRVLQKVTKAEQNDDKGNFTIR